MDVEFHLTLASLAQRQIPQQTLRHLFDRLYLKYDCRAIFSTPLKISDTEHIQLVEFVENRDLHKAQEVLSQHISNAKKHVLTALKAMMEEKEKSNFWLIEKLEMLGVIVGYDRILIIMNTDFKKKE